ncbi:MAG: hypothetical protein U0794_05035 [Isosphaeraceae bacterium]
MSIAEPSTVTQPVNAVRRTFRPKPVSTFEEAGLTIGQVESLVLKFLLNISVASGRRIAEELGLPFGPFPEFLRSLKNQQIVTYTNSVAANDYLYSLTDAGRHARKSTWRSAPTSVPHRSRSRTT